MKRKNSVLGFEGLYDVYSDGRIISLRTGRVMKQRKDPAGYMLVMLTKNNKQYSKKVHRIIAEAFIPGDHELFVNHINGVKSDNRISNLEWVTAKQNVKHAVETGLIPTGELHYNAKLGRKDVIAIRASKLKNKTLADIYGVTPSNIGCIKRRKTWAYV